jgi:hypothetical protein
MIASILLSIVISTAGTVTHHAMVEEATNPKLYYLNGERYYPPDKPRPSPTRRNVAAKTSALSR